MPPSRRSRNTSRASNIVLRDNDVLNGRGVAIAQRAGNQRFRYLVSQMKDSSYCEKFSSSEKKALACEIIKKIKELQPPGRFLKKDRDGCYAELSEAEVLKKTKQALRDCSRPDREGYASQVEVPQDVNIRRSGLSVQEIARRHINEQSKRSKSRSTNRIQRTPSNSTSASRSSRRATQKASTMACFTGTAERLANNPIRTTRNTAPREHPYHPQSMERAPPISSTSSSWTTNSAGHATPAVRPPIGPTPVTQTPNAPYYSFSQDYSHGIHPINHSGSNQSINGGHVASYNNNYPPRSDYNGQHHVMSQSIAPSPMVRPSSVRDTANIFDEQPEPLLEDWNRAANLFPHEDTLDTMAANLESAPTTGVINFDFHFEELHNDDPVHPNNGDLGI